MKSEYIVTEQELDDLKYMQQNSGTPAMKAWIHSTFSLVGGLLLLGVAHVVFNGINTQMVCIYILLNFPWMWYQIHKQGKAEAERSKAVMKVMEVLHEAGVDNTRLSDENAYLRSVLAEYVKTRV